MTQEPLDLGPFTKGTQRWPQGKKKPEPKPDDGSVKWTRLHTLERCHECIAEQKARLDGLLWGSPSVAWPASYARTEKGERIALCYTHAAPRREAEGLRPQRRSQG
jgi:hypothetical protein